VARTPPDGRRDNARDFRRPGAVRDVQWWIIEEDHRMLKTTNKKLGLVDQARTEAESLVKDLRRVGTGVQRRAERAMHDFEHGAEKLIGGLEARAVKAIASVLRRTFATRREMRELRGTVADLTRRLDDLARSERARKIDDLAHHSA
jgi:polyhydroxyalkanoate synthesis regulator phasin